MSFSLLDDAWIPVLRKDGTRHLIRPWELTDDYTDNPIETLAAPRADFAGAHIQFLIGLLQTAAAPDGEKQWREGYTSPPSPKEIRVRLEQYANVFRLDGEYPRFMQDSTAADAEDKSVAALLIESPGEKTIKLNTDHFIKRGVVEGLCPACAASALLTLQINAPSGGQGHRTSLRGGGPLSTILMDTTLWRTVWLNVLPAETFANSGGADNSKKEPKDIFPWMGPTRFSSSDGCQTTPYDTNPLHVYWATPRRIHLDTGATTTGTCSICGTPSEKLITTYRTKNYGFDYKGKWLHPLSPYTKNKDEEYLPEHGQPGGVRYKHWLGFIQPTEVKQQAIVVDYFLKERQGKLSRKQIDTSLRLFAFGYDMDNMKARGWYEGLMPVIWAPQHESEYKREAESAINAAGKTAEIVRFTLRAGLRKRKEDVKFDASILTAAESQFWSSTEAEFYTYLGYIRAALEKNTSREETKESTNSIKEQWLRTLQQSAMRCFHAVILSSPIEDNDPKRIAEAHNDLTRQLLYYKTLREILDLPYQDEDQKDTGKKAKKQKATA